MSSPGQGYSYYSVIIFCIVGLLLKVREAHATTDDLCIADCSNGYTNPSLYHQYCCLPPNNGNIIKLKKTETYKIITMCPPQDLPDDPCQEARRITYYSCSDILERLPGTATGNYNITQSNGSIVNVYCDMEGSNCDGIGGWTRVADIDMTKPNATCPDGLFQYTFENRVICDQDLDEFGSGCGSTFFTSFGINYTKVCGQVRGYQFGSVDGINRNREGQTLGIDDPYADGVSITHGSNPRQHIWTYIAGQDETTNMNENCPCNNGSSVTTPSYIGNDYYCESGSPSPIPNYHYVFYLDDALWDGQQCGSLESTCCISSKIPWFVKGLSSSTYDPIELRICTGESYPEEAIPIDITELYIK